MNLSTPHALQPFWDLTLSAVRADALRIALEWKLFDLLQVPTSAHLVARQLELDPANTGFWLEALWSMDLLQRDERQPPLAKPDHAATGHHQLAHDQPKQVARRDPPVDYHWALLDQQHQFFEQGMHHFTALTWVNKALMKAGRR